MRRTRGRVGNGSSTHMSGGSSHNSSQGNSGRRPGVPSRHQIFDSNGPEIRIRGTAWQVYEKYLGLARDAQASGDRVMTENHLQHAEHYYRIILAISEATGSEAFPQQQQQQRGRSSEGVEGSDAQPQSNESELANTNNVSMAGAEQPSDEGLATLQPTAAA